MEPLETVDVETDAGPYTIDIFPDYDALNPLTDWDHEGLKFYVFQPDGYRDSIILDTLSDAGRAGHVLAELIADHDDADEISRRFDKWRAIAGNPWTLVTGSGTGAVQGDWWNWYVLADAEWRDPVAAANGTMETYQLWAQGGFVGYVVKAPNGDTVASVWDFDDADYALEQATDSAEYDAKQRLDAANLVGAGFVGII